MPRSTPGSWSATGVWQARPARRGRGCQRSTTPAWRARHTENVGGHRRQLDPGVFEQLLQPLHLAGRQLRDLTRARTAITRERWRRGPLCLGWLCRHRGPGTPRPRPESSRFTDTGGGGAEKEVLGRQAVDSGRRRRSAAGSVARAVLARQRVCLGLCVQSIKRRILCFVDGGLCEINRVEREIQSPLGGPLGLLHVVFGFLLLDVCLHLGDMSLPLAANFLGPRR